MISPDPLFSVNYYQAKHIFGLPRDIRSVDDVTLSVDYARQSEVTSSLNAMLKSASERGDNVGIDEYDGPHANQLLACSTVFTISPVNRQKSTSSIVAFIVVGASTFSPTVDASLADIHVIRSRDITDVTYLNLVELAMEFTKELDLGYMECVMSVAASCEWLVRALTSQLNFTVVATLPRAVNMANNVGLTDSLVLVHNIAPTDYYREPRSEIEVLAMLSKHGMIDGVSDDLAFSRASLHSVSFLPQRYWFERANKTVTIRNMYKHEDGLTFGLLKAAAKIGEGIAIHKLPNLASFRRVKLLSGYCIVFEDESNGAVIGWFSITPSLLARSLSAHYAEITIALTKEYQNRGFLGDARLLMKGLVRRLGYRGTINYYFANNVRSKQLAQGNSNILLGAIPRAAYLVGAGWQNQVLVHKDYMTDDSPTFEQLIGKNRNKWNTKKSIISKL